MTVSIEKGNSHFSFLISHFSFLISHFSFLISHFSFLIFNVFLICYFDLICINEKKEIMKNVERVKKGEWNE